jgi:hypothetical protein
MRLLLAIGTAALSLTIVAPAYAQQEQHEQKEEEKAKPAEEKEKKAQPEKSAKPAERSAQEEKNARPEEKNAKQEAPARAEATPAKQEHASNGRIPDDRYKANFGREHTFRVSQRDFSSGRFQYGGYWFGFGGAWPSNWLYTQDVYVVEIDGMYYLCNPMYPGVNLVINVTL